MTALSTYVQLLYSPLISRLGVEDNIHSVDNIVSSLRLGMAMLSNITKTLWLTSRRTVGGTKGPFWIKNQKLWKSGPVQRLGGGMMGREGGGL